MGVSSNLEVFLSEKHLSDHKDREFTSVLTRPAMEVHDEECQASTKEDHEVKTKQQTVQERDHEQDEEHHQVQQQSNYDDNVTVLPEALSRLKLKIPPYKEVQEETEKEDSNDGFKTPTSEEHRIPVMLQCPPAPRKPRATTSSSKKRKGCCCGRTVLDLSQDIESLFPTVDRGAGGKNKKVKLFTEPQ